MEYFSVDNAGNEEELHSQTHSVDNEFPYTVIDVIQPYYMTETPEYGLTWVVDDGTTYFNFLGNDSCCCIHNVELENRVKDDDEEDTTRIVTVSWVVNKQTQSQTANMEDQSYKTFPLPDCPKEITITVTYSNGTLIRSDTWTCEKLVKHAKDCEFMPDIDSEGVSYDRNILTGEEIPFNEDPDVEIHGFYIRPHWWKPELNLMPLYRDKPCYSCIKSTKYRIWFDNIWSEWSEIEEPITFTEKGLHLLEYYSEDNIGHVEENNNETIIVQDIHSPNKPAKPSGPKSGKINKKYTYTASTIDLDGDQIYYRFNWGDGNISDLLGPYESGELCEASYIWKKQGAYGLKVIARDEYSCFSGWSNPLTVTVTKARSREIFNQPLLQLLQKFFNNTPNLFSILRLLLQR
jgi:hypothetical protein